MKKTFFSLIAAVVCLSAMLCGCEEMYSTASEALDSALQSAADEAAEILETVSLTETETVPTTEEISESETEKAAEISETEPETVTETEPETEPVTEQTEEITYPPETTVTESETQKLSVEKNGSYTTPEDVAEYIHTFGTLPKNFITKKEAQALGWDSKKGNLWEVTDKMSIGGDRFGNYEGLLPDKKGRKYTECDVNYSGGSRGAERIVFSNDGLIYYTNDHYQTFTQLY